MDTMIRNLDELGLVIRSLRTRASQLDREAKLRCWTGPQHKTTRASLRAEAKAARALADRLDGAR